MLVHKCRADGQGHALGVQEGSIVLRVAGRAVHTLEEFEEGVVRLRQQGDPSMTIPVVLLAPGPDDASFERRGGAPDPGGGSRGGQQQSRQSRQSRGRGGSRDEKGSVGSLDSESDDGDGHGLSKLFKQQSIAAPLSAEAKSGSGSRARRRDEGEEEEEERGGGGMGDKENDWEGGGGEFGPGDGGGSDDESLGLLGVEDKALAAEAKGEGSGMSRRGGNNHNNNEEEEEEEDGGGRDGWAFATGGGMEVGGDGDDNDDDGDDGGLMAGRAEAKYDGGEGLFFEPGLPVPTVLHPLPEMPFAMGVSVDDKVPVVLYFVNQSPHMQLEIGWVDYEGRLVPRKLLAPGDAHLERSWASHPWLLSAIQPPAFDPALHASPEDADALPPQADDRDMTLLLRVGEAAAKSQSRGYSLLWQPRDRALSFMPQSRADPGKLRPELDPANATDSATRVRNTRASLVQQLRELRADPSGGANGGKPPTITVLMMANQHGASVVQPYS